VTLEGTAVEVAPRLVAIVMSRLCEFSIVVELRDRELADEFGVTKIACQLVQASCVMRSQIGLCEGLLARN
jgi:hypothetical protein